jgi:predicted transporter
MHARKHNHRLAALVSTLLTVILIGAGAFIWSSSHKATSNAIQTVVTVPQPPTAAQIASSEKCVNYKDGFTKDGWPTVLDVGNCYVGSVKYAIDTFANPANRDAWLKVASVLGVVPVWETSTSVTYKSVSN